MPGDHLRGDLAFESRRALVVTERAIGLDGTNRVAHGVLALSDFGHGEFDRFTVQAENAVSLNPNNALWLAILGSYMAPLGHWERGLSMVNKALALNAAHGRPSQGWRDRVAPDPGR